MFCNVCPRACFVDRNTTLGYCGVKNKVVISKVMLHKFEEPIISSGKGSGAIFFAGCNLKCVFCQNYKISHKIKGKKVDAFGLIKIFKKLEKQGAVNINLVTPTHYSLQIIEALKIYKPNIPVVWNSSGYESEKTIESLKGLVDVFLVDLKYMDNKLAKKYSGADNYVENATATILKMKQLAPNNVIENGIIKSGIIVRHMILPTHTEDSVNCLKFVLNNLGKDTIVSIMSQYEPMHKAELYPEINRNITPLEYKRVVNFAVQHGMDNCYTQELTSANKKYTPKF